MNWRRLNQILFGIVLVITVIRFMTGNIIGGLLSAAIAAVLGSIAFDFPLLSRARRLWRLLRLRGSDDKRPRS